MKSHDLNQSISCGPANADEASKEYWHRLEKLMQEHQPIPVPKQAGKRDLRTFACGILVAATAICIYQSALNTYDAAVERSLRIPQATEAAQLPLIADLHMATGPFAQALAKFTVSAQNSTITAVVDPNTLTSSIYWTLALKNSSGRDQEAQALLKLPAGAVVSRATLWINGVPQEAAFSTSSKVESAYNWITQKHRDPLLVTYKDDGMVSIKASPVPANGDIMKIRLGITAPMEVGADGQGVLTVPEIKECNFTMAEKNNLHIESKLPIQPVGSLLKAERTATGKYLLKGSLKANELAKVAIAAPEAGLNGNYAVRATHSLPGTFILSKMNDPGEEEAISLTRRSTDPDCRIIRSEAAAHRVSTLWAAGEIKRLLAQGKRNEAEDLASVFRIVSPVSGAVVLEYDSDYQFNGLNRDQYMVAADGQRPNASSFSGLGQSVAPILQGATNGSIAPQGDVTVIQGINSAGTVRVNNFGNIEALLNILHTACDFGLLTAAIFLTLRGIRKIARGQMKNGVKDECLALTMALFGMLWLLAAPFIAVWKLGKCSTVKQT